MNIITRSLKAMPLLVVALLAVMLSSCNSGKSYADLLNQENRAANLYLSNHKVVNDIPADSVFEYGPEAPFYRMDEDGFVYMQVIDPGNLEEKAYDDQTVYFRFMRYNLTYNLNFGQMPTGEGNDIDMQYQATCFKFNNLMWSNSQMYGSGIQTPLKYLGVECVVNLIIKSEYGFSTDVSSGNCFLYSVRYLKSKI